MKLSIKVAYHHSKIPEIVIDESGQIWRLPFTGKTGRKYKIKLLEPFYERNYIAYRVRGRKISQSFIFKHKKEKRYILEVEADPHPKLGD